MKKKASLVNLLFFVLIMMLCTLHISTNAFYKTMAESGNNTISTSSFKVKDDGSLERQTNFKIGKFTPGQSAIWRFEINKSGTDLPVEYIISLYGRGNLFDRNSPIVYSVKDSSDNENSSPFFNEGKAVKYRFIPHKDIEEYTVNIEWPWATPKVEDKDYLGKEGSIDIVLKANQVQN